MNNSDGTPRRDRRGYASQLLGEEHSSNFLLINSRAGPSELRRENGLRTSRVNPSLSSEADSLVTTLSRSDVTFAKNFLESAINESVVVIHGNVSVQYSGRASSRANLAPRIVITKPDGTLLVHESTKSMPINWQPPGSRFNVSVQESSLVLEAFRKKDREMIVLLFQRLFYIAASNVTQGNFSFSGSESGMVDVVIRNPKVIEEGFVSARREFRTPYGSIDLIGRDKQGNQLVLEFKRRRAQLSSVSQLDRYVSYIKENQDRANGAARTAKRGKKVRGGVVAPSITKEALTLLNRKGYEFFKLKPVLYLD